MLARKRPEVILAKLDLEAQGERLKFNVTFHNRRQSEMEVVIADGVEKGLDAQEAGIALVLFVLKEFETEYELTTQGLREMEEDLPGICRQIMFAFYQARVVEKAKN